jgi:pimeloyl-ACP methyl ester carboxylesterase
MAPVSGAVIRRRIAALLAVDETAALTEIRVPTLVLRAARDRVVSDAATAEILHGIAHAREVVIEGPHLLLQTCAAACAAAVLEFMLEGHDLGRQSSGQGRVLSN